IEEHIWEEGTVTRLGETGRRMGSLVLSWDAVKAGAADPSNGKNVVLHELAHQLDYENYAADGVPGLATREQQLAWSEVMSSEFASLRAADETGIPPSSIPTELLTQPSSSRCRLKLSLSSRVRCALVIRNCTPSCENTLSRIR